MWDLIGAIVSGLASGIPSGKRPAEPEAGPSFGACTVISTFLILLAAGFVFLSFVPDAWWQMLLIQFLALLLVLMALAVFRAALLDRRKRLTAPGHAFPIIPAPKPDPQKPA